MRIVYIEIASRSRYDDAPQFRTADTTQIDMAESREELVVGGVGSTPPALVLIELIQLGGARYIEWRDTHQAIRDDGSRVSRTEVRGPDEGIDFIDESLGALRPCIA